MSILGSWLLLKIANILPFSLVSKKVFLATLLTSGFNLNDCTFFLAQICTLSFSPTKDILPTEVAVISIEIAFFDQDSQSLPLLSLGITSPGFKFRAPE